MTSPVHNLRVAVAQANFVVGDLDANLARIRASIEQAQRARADLLVLSECALLGYPPRDLLDRRELVLAQLDALKEVAQMTTEGGPGVVLGYIDETSEKHAKPLRNAAALCFDGEIKARVFKRLLPSYDVFDEDRYFEPGDRAEVVDFRGVPLGLSICEDAWNDHDFWEESLYPADPIAELVDAGAQVIINPSASPFHIDKVDLRRRMLAAHAHSLNCWVVFANQVGGQDELIFDGHSLIVAPGGRVVRQLAGFREDFAVQSLDLKSAAAAEPAYTTHPTAENIGAAAQARRALVLGLRDYVHKTGFKGAIIGLSGGIDSAVTAALAAEALGPQHIMGVSMPSPYSSEHSMSDARALAHNLGIDFSTLPISHTFASFQRQLGPLFEGLAEDVTEENLQARIRGTTLMALSNKFGKLVLAPSNKSESAVGYTTLYGDMVGALCVIGDCYKQLVYAIAHHINDEAGREIIPSSTLTKPPSAELRPGQTDQDSLPDYEILDPLLRGYIEEGLSAEDLVARGFHRDTVSFVLTLVHRNEYKRWQAPPILKIRPKAFGVGWRYPLAASYRTLTADSPSAQADPS